MRISIVTMVTAIALAIAGIAFYLASSSDSEPQTTKTVIEERLLSGTEALSLLQAYLRDEVRYIETKPREFTPTATLRPTPTLPGYCEDAGPRPPRGCTNITYTTFDIVGFNQRARVRREIQGAVAWLEAPWVGERNDEGYWRFTAEVNVATRTYRVYERTLVVELE